MKFILNTKIHVFLLAGCILFCRPHGAVAQVMDPPSVPTSIRNGSPVNSGGVVRNGGIEKRGGEVSEAVLRHCCEKIAKEKRKIWYLGDRNGKMQLQVRGIYTHGAAMFFLLRLNNHSSLDYDIDSVRFLITGYGKGRTAVRNSSATKRLEPVYVHDSTSMVPGFSRAASIFVLRRFTLPPGRQLLIEVQEKNGGRHLRIGVFNWALERARII